MLFMKGNICKLFGWTFNEYEDQPADEVLGYMHLLSLYDEYVQEQAAARQS